MSHTGYYQQRAVKDRDANGKGQQLDNSTE